MSFNQLLNLVNRYEKTLTELEDDAIARLNQSIENGYRELVNKLNYVYPTIADNITLLPAQRELLITAQLGDLLNIISPDSENDLRELIVGADDIGGRSVDEIIKAIDPDLVAANFAVVPLEAAAIAASRSYQDLLGHGERFARSASQAISQGVLQGWGSRKIAQLIRQRAEVTQRQAIMIARTESLKAAAGASKQRYVDSGINYGVWVTVLTEVCPWCTSKTGKIYKIEDMVIPQHPYCRCTLIPVTPQWVNNDLLDFPAIAEYSDRVREKSGSKVRYDKAPFENSPPKEVTLESLRRKRDRPSLRG
ncbi:MAG: hypothetical protein F6K65_22135 [Moorea sp. SIO3C2]|nr:hypothetical protein [Moorena sp. SIO3C2]